MTDEADTPPTVASEPKPTKKFRVVIHRDFTYEAPNAEYARSKATSDLFDSIHQSPGTNDTVYEGGAGPEYWAVQPSHGGIPDEPMLFYDLDTVLRHVAGLAADMGLDPTSDETEANCGEGGGYVGDTNGDDEVRWWKVGEPTDAGESTTASDPSDLPTEKAVLYGTVLGYLKAESKSNP